MPPEDRDFLDDAGDFNDAMWDHIGKNSAGVMKGLWSVAQSPFDAIEGGVKMATDPAAGAKVWAAVNNAADNARNIAQATGEYGEAVLQDPAMLYRDARSGILGSAQAVKDGAQEFVNRQVDAHFQAAAGGQASKYWGGLAGDGLFGAVTMAAGGAELEGVNAAKGVGEVVDAAGGVEKIGATLENPALKETAEPISSTVKCPASQQVVEGVSKEVLDLAKAPGNTPAQIAARKQIATEFYQQYPPYVPPSATLDETISSHLKGVNFNQPLSPRITQIDESVMQWAAPPGDSLGNYSSSIGATPSELGIGTYTVDATGSIVEKGQYPSVIPAGTPVLDSIAAPMKDKFSVLPDKAGKAGTLGSLGWTQITKGGAAQMYAPKQFYGKLLNL